MYFFFQNEHGKTLYDDVDNVENRLSIRLSFKDFFFHISFMFKFFVQH
jgi:hypothetical protein